MKPLIKWFICLLGGSMPLSESPKAQTPIVPSTASPSCEKQPTFFLTDYSQYRTEYQVPIPQKAKPSALLAALDRKALKSCNQTAIQDPLLNGYLKGLMARIYPEYRQSKHLAEQFDLQISLQPSAEVNAYATGYRVFTLFSGLFFSHFEESTILNIMGHELGHLQAGHIEQQVTEAISNDREQLLDLLTLVVPIPTRAFKRQQEITRRSQRNELQADALGADLAYNAGVDPKSALLFLSCGEFERMVQNYLPASGVNSDGVTAEQIKHSFENWFSTHPSDIQRELALKCHFEKFRKKAYSPLNSPEFWFAKVRLFFFQRRLTEASLERIVGETQDVSVAHKISDSATEREEKTAAKCYGEALLAYARKDHSAVDRCLNRLDTLQGGPTLWSLELSAQSKLDRKEVPNTEWQQLQTRWRRLQRSVEPREQVECLTLTLVLGSLAERMQNQTEAIKFFEFGTYLDALNLFAWQSLERLYPPVSSAHFAASAQVDYLSNVRDDRLTIALQKLRRAIEIADAEENVAYRKFMQQRYQKWSEEAKFIHQYLST